MKKKNAPVLITPMYFPDHLVTDAEKGSETFGLKVGQAIQYEWFNQSGNAGSCEYYNQWLEIHKLRLYARGEQPIGQYQEQMKVNGDLSHINLNWQIVKIAPKYVDIVVNGMNDRLFSVKAFSEDVTSSEMRDRYQKNIEADMIARDFLTQTQEQFGIDAFNVPPETLPYTDQELQLHMQLDYKPAIEIAEETAISTVFDMNDFLDVKYRYNTDQVTLGRGFVKHEYVHSEGIRIKYVDPQNLVHSYTENPYYDDVFYWGEVVQIPILELKKINPNLTPEDIQKIKQSSGTWNNAYSVMRPYNNGPFEKDVVNVLYFNYKSDKNFVYKVKTLENGGKRAIRRDETFNPEMAGEAETFKRVDKTIDVWYDGALVLGTDILLKWELAKNMVRPEASSQRAYPNYIGCAPKMYKGNYDSLVKRMVPMLDQVQLNHLKLQQMLQRMIPDGIFVDADGFVGINLGNGAKYGPQEAVDMYMATGTIIGRSLTEDGDFNQAKMPIKELNTSSGQSKLSVLVQTYNHWMNMVRDVTGVNEARDASNPDPNSLVGLQKMAALNSNIATKHILEAGLFMTKRLATSISLRISDVLEYAEDREEFANQIGKSNVSILDSIRSLPMHYFGIFIEVSPDEEQKSILESNIQIALKAGSILLEDANDIREVRNLKLANELLKLKTRKKQERDQQQEEFKMKAQSAAQIQAAQASAKAKQEQIAAEAQVKMSVEKAKTDGEIAVLQEEARLKKELMAEEFNYQMQLAGQESQLIKNKEDRDNEAKSKREKERGTIQSKMITQRHNDTPPINFESNEDTLDGLDFDSFG